MKTRPTDAEFEELKLQRAAAIDSVLQAVAKQWGCDPADLRAHDCDAGQCYCACPDGPCQHVWNGPEHSEDCMSSVTCSRCGTPAIYHDMRCMS